MHLARAMDDAAAKVGSSRRALPAGLPASTCFKFHCLTKAFSHCSNTALLCNQQELSQICTKNALSIGQQVGMQEPTLLTTVCSLERYCSHSAALSGVSSL